MKLNLTPSDWSLADHLFEILASNIDASNLLNDFLSTSLAIPSDLEIKSISKRRQLNEPQAMLYYLTKELSGGRVSKPIDRLVQAHVRPAFRALSPTPFIENPFYQLVPSLQAQVGEWVLHTTSYQRYEFFIYNDVIVSPTDYQETLQLGYFSEPFSYLSVEEQSVNWMSITPNEIATMEPSLTHMRGRVLVLGLGLGYFAARCALKDEISSITVIERDARVIQLFKTHILPHLPHAEKIVVIQEDAMTFLKHNASTYAFDSTFIDLWHTADDGLPLYLQLKASEYAISPTQPFHYWIETSLLAMLRRVVLTVISELRDGATDRDFQRRETILDDIINAVYFHFKDVSLDSYQLLHDLLSEVSLQRLASLLDFKFTQN